MGDSGAGNLCQDCGYLVEEINRASRASTDILAKSDRFTETITLTGPKRLFQAFSRTGCDLCSAFPHLVAAFATGDLRLHLEWQSNVKWLRYGEKSKPGYFSLILVPDGDEKFAPFERNVQLSRNTKDNGFFDLARYWLSECLQKHDECGSQNTQPQKYPSRLLKIEGDLVRVVRTLDTPITEPYATLSHCWGREPFAVLRENTFSMLEGGVRVDTFLPTFRDAILVAQQLHIRLLWIDCFCIVQSDPAEVRQELARMGEVYANAVLNIATASASSPQDGCFVHQKRDPVRIVQLPARANSGEKSYRLLDEGHIETELHDFNKDNPVFTRAWCFQERLLCPRMLHIGKVSMYWECRRSPLASEIFPDGSTYGRTAWNPSISKPFSIPLQNQWPFNNLPRADLALERAQNRIAAEWRWMVQSYSSMDLTRPNEDKLAAIGGVAKYIARLINDEYIAGFFRRSFLSHITWRRVPTYEESQHLTRPAAWRAPSWSWASVDGRIEMHTIVPNETFARLQTVALASLDKGNPFGALTDGWVVLEGWLLTVACRHQERHQERHQSYVYWGDEHILVYFDDLRSYSKLHVFLTNYASANPRDNSNYREEPFRGSGLVLQRTKSNSYNRHMNSNLFERVGVFVYQGFTGKMHAAFLKNVNKVSII